MVARTALHSAGRAAVARAAKVPPRAVCTSAGLSRRSLRAFPAFQLVEAPPTGPSWFDGYRMQVHVDRGQVRWRTRSGLNGPNRLADFRGDLAPLPDCILDGELCVRDVGGQPDVSTLRSAMARRKAGVMAGVLIDFVFDMLLAGAEDLTGLPLEAVKTRLAATLAPGGQPVSPRVRLVEPVDAEARKFFRARAPWAWKASPPSAPTPAWFERGCLVVPDRGALVGWTRENRAA